MSARPTFHESWYRVATLRPRLRSTLRTYRQMFRGREWHVIHDRANNQHFRLDAAGYRFVGLLDGQRTVADAWAAANEHLGDAGPTQGEVINTLGQLYLGNLLHSDLPADAASMFEHQRKRKLREVGGFFSNVLFMRFPLFDPDAFLTRWLPLAGPLFSRWGLLAWIVLIGFGFASLAGRFGELLSGASGVIAPDNLFLLYASFAVVKAIHEFGHGFAAKRIGSMTGSGGEVHTMGIMLLVFTPIPYVDASSSWAFRSRWHRAFVGAAGMYVEFAVAAIAAIVWANTSPGLVNAIAYNVIFVASVSTLLFNANPLLRFDGYYILSDVLEIPNLANRSKQQLHHLVKKFAYGVKQSQSAIRGRGEQFWLPVYGVASMIYRIIIFAGIILFVADKFFILGAIFAVVSLVAWVVVPLGKWIRYLASSPELARVRPRAVAVSVLTLGVIIGFFGGIPWPDRGRAEGVVEPRSLAIVYARTSGFVESVLPTGTMVTPDGPPVFVADNLELRTQREGLEADRRVAEVQRNEASVREIALAQSLSERIDALDERLAQIDADLADLDVEAPIAGCWTAPELDRREGTYVQRGERLGVVADLETLFVRAVADQSLGPRLGPEVGVGGAAELRVKGRPGRTYIGRITQVLPSGDQTLPSVALGYTAGGQTAVSMRDPSGTQASEPFFEVQVDLDDADPDLWSGQRVVVRFDMPARPLLGQWWRSLRRLIQRRFQI